MTDDGKTDGLFGANTLDQTQQAKATFLALTERHGDIMKVILLQIFWSDISLDKSVCHFPLKKSFNQKMSMYKAVEYASRVTKI